MARIDMPWRCKTKISTLVSNVTIGSTLKLPFVPWVGQIYIGRWASFTLVATVLLAAGGHLWVMFAGIQLFFLAFNIMEALLPSLISKESPADYKGTAMDAYSTSQFLSVAFGGMLGGFLFQLQGTWLVFLAGVAIAPAWWLVSATLREPPYVSSLRMALPGRAAANSQLAKRLQAQLGVTEVVVPEEHSAYVKVDTKQTNRAALEKTAAAALTTAWPPNLACHPSGVLPDGGSLPPVP